MGRLDTARLIGMLALVMGFGATVLVLSHPAYAANPWVTLNGDVGPLTIGNNDSTLSFNTGFSHITISLNLAHANTWSGTQTFSSADGVLAGMLNFSQAYTGCNECAQLFTDTSTNVYGKNGGSLVFNIPQGYGTYYRANGANVFTINSPYPSGTGYFSYYGYDWALNSFPFYYQDTYGGTDLFGLSSTGIQNTQGFQSFNCSIANAVPSQACTLAVTEPDTSYYAVCNLKFGSWTAANGLLQVLDTSASQITLVFGANSPVAGTNSATCIVTHQ